jgi:phosphoribosylaminoimidazole-succinocarboxamide synthase
MDARSDQVVVETSLGSLPARRGKVRDIYDLGERLLLIATDRISAFDWVLPTPIPGKGITLTQLSRFWFDFLGEPNHLITTDARQIAEALGLAEFPYPQRSMLVHKTRVVPIECVVRGYLAGSGWQEYVRRGTVCGERLPAGLRQGERLPEPIFTPATKAESGHDENMSFAEMCRRVGEGLAEELRRRSLEVYRRGAEHAQRHGILIADTKLEWGIYPPHDPQGRLLLIDEVLTPDSSRFWPAADYRPGSNPPSFDKQYVRDWLEQSGWDKNSPPPALPPEVVERTAAKYQQAWRILTGQGCPETTP